MNRLVKLVGDELLRHHEFASKAQAAAIQRMEAARAKSASRGGSPTNYGGLEEYTPKPFDPASINNYKLSALRESDVTEVSEYLKHQRQYKELMERYAPAPDDNREHVEKTARRVGLDASKL